MQCIECHERPATLHLTEIINGKKSERHVCDYCAQKKGYVMNQDEAYSLHDLITGLFGMNQMDLQQGQRVLQEEAIKCEQCEMSFHEFRNIGRFGCAHCYKSFKKWLSPIFRRIHSGSLKHHGKIPKRQGGKLHAQKELANYRDELTHLIEQEEFERAAVIRDKIKGMEEEKEGGHS